MPDLIPRPGIDPAPPAPLAVVFNHWTPQGSPHGYVLNHHILFAILYHHLCSVHVLYMSSCASFPSGLVVVLLGSHTTSSNQGTVEGNGARAPASAPPGFVGELGPPSPDSVTWDSPWDSGGPSPNRQGKQKAWTLGG